MITTLPKFTGLLPANTRTWKNYLLTGAAILVWMVVALIILHCLVNNQYGFHRDELNFIEGMVFKRDKSDTIKYISFPSRYVVGEHASMTRAM